MKFTVITKLNIDVETEDKTVPLVEDMLMIASVIKPHLIPFNFSKSTIGRSPGVEMGGGGTKGGGGENGGDPGQGRPVTGPHRFRLLAKLKMIENSYSAFCQNQRRKVQALTRNLMGVNKEKEPLSGTSPDRWLFDRSLNFKMQS